MRNFTIRNTAYEPEVSDVGIRYRAVEAREAFATCRESAVRATGTNVYPRNVI